MSRGGAHDGRIFADAVEAQLQVGADGRVQVLAPSVGLFRDGPAPGALVTPGVPIGQLEQLGRRVRLDAPAGAAGIVQAKAAGRSCAKRAVGYGEVLFVLDPRAAGAALHDAKGAEVAGAFEGLCLRAPSSGRFYDRPSPGAPPFVGAGDAVSVGQTVALLEVMKTFNRVLYGGAGLPERARVVRVVPANEADVEAGEALLQLEPLAP